MRLQLPDSTKDNYTDLLGKAIAFVPNISSNTLPDKIEMTG